MFAFFTSILSARTNKIQLLSKWLVEVETILCGKGVVEFSCGIASRSFFSLQDVVSLYKHQKSLDYYQFNLWETLACNNSIQKWMIMANVKTQKENVSMPTPV
jgi:hypothetical protein